MYVNIKIVDMFRASTRPSSGGKGVLSQHLVSSLCVQYSTENDDNRCCDNTIFPPEDGRVDARNMSRILMLTYILLMSKGIVH
jgi:hypothetical protein